jgi:unsaturated rhamnogalacturonyl hydrolase
MKRRNFLQRIPVAGFGLGLTGTFLQACSQKKQSLDLAGEKTIVEKVKHAMLSMQRATWEQGVAMQAMLESGEKEMVILMAKDAVLRQSKDGRLAMLGEDVALSDAACPGEAVLWAAKQTGDPVLTEGFNKLLDYILNKAPRNSDGIIYHFSNVPQVWSDINYMLPPFLAVAGKSDEAVKQIEGVKAMLWNPDKKMLSHQWDCDAQKFLLKDCWGVGNGWTAAGLTRVIRMLPASMQEQKSELLNYLKDIIDGCTAHMREDGLYHNMVDEPDTFVETNLSQMLAYSIYRGIKERWLDASYKDKADKMRAAVHLKVDEFGLVQGVCGSPDFEHPGTAAEGQAFFIMMEVAHKELTES